MKISIKKTLALVVLTAVAGMSSINSAHADWYGRPYWHAGYYRPWHPYAYGYGYRPGYYGYGPSVYVGPQAGYYPYANPYYGVAPVGIGVVPVGVGVNVRIR